MGIEDIVIEECEGVYAPAEDSYLLLKTVRCGHRVLEIGSGSGLVSIACALNGSSVDSVDVNKDAVDCTLRNASVNDVELNAYQSSLFSGVPKENVYDTIIFNPPYLPTNDSLPGGEQWNGGEDGFQIIRPFLMEAPSHLAKAGSIFIVISSQTDVLKLMKEFPELEFSSMGEESFFFEKIFVFRVNPKSTE